MICDLHICCKLGVAALLQTFIAWVVLPPESGSANPIRNGAFLILLLSLQRRSNMHVELAKAQDQITNCCTF